MNIHKQGWFTEFGDTKRANVALSIKSSRILHEEQTKYQKICVFER